MTVTDTYHIEIPGDLGSLKEILEAAIDEARERARLYVIPCEWSAELESGEVGDFMVTVKVTRRRNK